MELGKGRLCDTDIPVCVFIVNQQAGMSVSLRLSLS